MTSILRELAHRRLRSRKLSPQPWPWPGPRVLVEEPDEREGLELAGILREAGYAVAVCPGPGSAERCPLSGAEGCAVAHGADVVVSGLAIRRPEVLELLRTRVPRTPLVVLADKDTAPALPDGCLRVGVPVDPRELVSTVADAVAVKQREPER